MQTTESMTDDDARGRPQPTPAPAAGGERGASRGLAGDAATIAAAVALSRLTGLARIVVVAAVLGPTVLGDLFVAVNVLPLILYDVIAGSAISSVLVPPIVRLLATEPVERVRRFVATATGMIVAGMSAVVVLAILGHSWIADALTAGVDRLLADDAARVAGLLLVLIVPQLVLYAVIGVCVAVQHAERRFLLPSAAPIVENLTLIATVVVAGKVFGTGQEVSDVSTGLLLLLGLGSGLAVGAHAAVQYAGARRAVGGFGLAFDRSDAAVRDLAGPARDSFGWSSVVALRQFALVVGAAYAGAGAVQAFEIATLVYFVPVALIGRPVASAALPRLASAGGDERALAGYLHALRLAAWLAVPAGLALVVLAGPLAGAVAYGRFVGDEPIRLLTLGLAGLGIGAASEALFEVARQATMARAADRGALLRSTWFRATTALAGIPAVVVTLDGPAVLLALGLVVTAGDAVALLVLHRSLRTDPSWPPHEVTGAAHWPRIVAASVVAVGLAATVDLTVTARWSGPIGNPARLAAVGATAAAAYLVAGWLATGRGRLLGLDGASILGRRSRSSVAGLSADHGSRS